MKWKCVELNWPRDFEEDKNIPSKRIHKKNKNRLKTDPCNSFDNYNIIIFIYYYDILLYVRILCAFAFKLFTYRSHIACTRHLGKIPKPLSETQNPMPEVDRGLLFLSPIIIY